MILVPLLHTLKTSPWIVVLLSGTLAVAWLVLLAAWMSLDDGELWM